MDHKILSANDRAILIDDALNLAQFNYLNYSLVQQLLECWNAQETEYLPWKAALVNLEFVYRNSIDYSVANGFHVSVCRGLRDFRAVAATRFSFFGTRFYLAI